MATNNASNTSNPVTVAQGGSGDTSLTAYAIVCGGTTSTGALQNVSGVGTAGQILVSNGAGALPSWQSTTAGSWILLNTQTASNSANLTFTSTYITSTYISYVAIIRGINNAATAQFQMQWSTNNGTGYLSSAYQSGIWYNNYNSSSLSNGNSTSICNLTPSITNTNVPLNGVIYLFFPASAPAAYNGQLFTQDTTSVNVLSGGINSGTTTINNVQFLYSSGNITSGTISLYGIGQ